MNMKQIQVFLVDDSQIHLEGLKLLLSEDQSLVIVGEATHADNVLQHPALTSANVILLDISLQAEYDGIDLIQPILQRNPKVKIIMLSHNKDIHSIVTSIQNGAKAYLAKDTSLEELTTAIQVVIQGHGLFLGETIPKATLLNCFAKTPTNHSAKTWNLSQREIEIIEWLAKGFISKEIAEALHINVTTVESHKDNIKQKLNLKTVVEIVVFALQNGIITTC
jgi:DNA-binding NarL/FixJ family response regulator